MKKNYTNILSLILIVSISLLGCKKTEEDYTSTAESAESFAQEQPMIMSTFDMIDDFLGNQNFMQKNGNPIIPNSAYILYGDTIFSDGNGIEVTIGLEEEALCGDNFYRKGVIRIVADKPYSEIGSTTTIEVLDMFSIKKNGYFLALTKSLFLNSSFTIKKIEESKYTFDYNTDVIEDLNPNPDSKRYSGNFIITKIAGFNTPELTDDEIKIDGDGKGFSRASESNFTFKILESLNKNPCAKIFTKGKLTLQNDGSEVILEINFGDGTCDTKVEVKSGVFKKEITL